MGIEFELKFSATPAQQEQIRQAFPLPYRSIRMQTTYYDTADGALSARHITLRRRMENEASVCTVKTPIAGLGRGEWECLCENIEDAIPMLCKLSASRELIYLTAPGVEPICGARFTRQAGLLEYQNAQLELALDCGVLYGGGREMDLCEIEVELKSGEPDSAIAFARELAARYGLHSEKKSKFRRALALAKGE